MLVLRSIKTKCVASCSTELRLVLELNKLYQISYNLRHLNIVSDIFIN